MEKVYAVNLWGSHPDADNDDCWTGDDFDTLDAARAVFENPAAHFSREGMRSTVFVQIDGPDVYEVRRVAPDRKPSRCDDWRREIAMEAGMLHGCEGYNEVMGY